MFFLFFRNSDVPNRRASACGLDCPDYVNGSTWYRHKSYAPPKVHSNANKRYFSVRFQIKSKLQLSQGNIFVSRIRKRTSLQSQLNTISQFRGHQRGKICVISRSWSLKKKRKKSHPGMQIYFRCANFMLQDKQERITVFGNHKKSLRIFMPKIYINFAGFPSKF